MTLTPSRFAVVLALAPLVLAAACHKSAPAQDAKAVANTAPAQPKAAAPKVADTNAPGAAKAAAGQPAAMVTSKDELPRITPAALAAELKAGHKPMLIQVGFPKLYQQAHIPGSVYTGPGMTQAGIANLRAHMQKVHHDTPIVVYCGCCPWSHCPNVLPAYQALQQMGFTKVKVLYIANDFGADWASQGYPVASGS